MKLKFVLLIILFLLADAMFGQCAMCRAVLESGGDQSAAEGINDGIVFLMAIPYILVAVIGFIIYKKFSGANKSE